MYGLYGLELDAWLSFTAASKWYLNAALSTLVIQANRQISADILSGDIVFCFKRIFVKTNMATNSRIAVKSY